MGRSYVRECLSETEIGVLTCLMDGRNIDDQIIEWMNLFELRKKKKQRMKFIVNVVFKQNIAGEARMEM